MRECENCGANLDSGERKQKFPDFKIVQKQGGLNQ